MQEFKTIITNIEALVMKQANAKQRQWMKDISEFTREHGLGFLYGPEYEGRTDFQLHHVLGRSAKHNKVSIGHWFIIPVPVELHDVSSNHPDNVTHFKNNFKDRFGEQCGLFQILYAFMDKMNDYRDEPYNMPSIGVYNTIMDTNA